MNRLGPLFVRRWPLAVKLTLATAAVVIVAVAGVTTLAVQREGRDVRRELEAQANLLLATLAASAADPLYKLDVDRLSDLVAGWTENQMVTSVRVYDARGRIVTDAKDPLAALRLQTDAFGQRLVSSDTPVFRWESGQLIAGRAVTDRKSVV